MASRRTPESTMLREMGEDLEDTDLGRASIRAARKIERATPPPVSPAAGNSTERAPGSGEHGGNPHETAARLRKVLALSAVIAHDAFGDGTDMSALPGLLILAAPSWWASVAQRAKVAPPSAEAVSMVVGFFRVVGGGR